MDLKELYNYFLQTREALLRAFEDYPYGEDWSDEDSEEFESALANYSNYYNLVNSYLNDNKDSLKWKSKEAKEMFLKQFKNVAESDYKVFNSLKIRNKWHKEFEKNQTSILVRMSRELKDTLYLGCPRKKVPMYQRVLEAYIKLLGPNGASITLLDAQENGKKKYGNAEWAYNNVQEARQFKLNEDDIAIVWKSYIYVRKLSIAIFDGLTSTDESIGFNGYGFQGRKYVPAYCSGGISLNRQDWLRLKDAYEDFSNNLDYGVAREKRLRHAELSYAKAPYSKGQLISSKFCSFSDYKKNFADVTPLYESRRPNVKHAYDFKNHRLKVIATKDINSGNRFIF